MRYRVVVLRHAKQEILDIASYIADRSMEGSLRWLDQAEEAVETLQRNPESYSLAPENDLVEQEIRQKLFRTRRGRMDRMVFSICGNEVHVLHVLGAGQQILTADELAEDQPESE